MTFRDFLDLPTGHHISRSQQENIIATTPTLNRVKNAAVFNPFTAEYIKITSPPNLIGVYQDAAGGSGVLRFYEDQIDFQGVGQGILKLLHHLNGELGGDIKYY